MLVNVCLRGILEERWPQLPLTIIKRYRPSYCLKFADFKQCLHYRIRSIFTPTKCYCSICKYVCTQNLAQEQQCI